jgi:hypothetical protein
MTKSSATSNNFKLPPPPEPTGWGEDELTKFLEHTRQNQRATFANKRDAMAKLVNIDAQFAKVTKGWAQSAERDRRDVVPPVCRGAQLDAALKTTAQCGMIVLELFETIYGPKFELLGIKAAMLDLRRTGI